MRYEVRGFYGMGMAEVGGTLAGECFDSYDEASLAGTSATVIIDHLEREVFVPEVINNTFRGVFLYSPETTMKVFAAQVDWAKMRRRLEDRLRKDITALRYVVGKLGIEIAYK